MGGRRGESDPFPSPPWAERGEKKTRKLPLLWACECVWVCVRVIIREGRGVTIQNYGISKRVLRPPFTNRKCVNSPKAVAGRLA